MGLRRTSLLLIPLLLLGLMAAALLLALDGDSPRSLFEAEGDAAAIDGAGVEPDVDGGGSRGASGPRRVGRPGHITGDVRDLRTREPAAGRVVTLTLSDGDIRQVTTGADGGFGFGDLIPDVAHELRIDGDDHAPVVRPGLFLRSGERLDVGTLWLADGVHVAFEVRSFDGRPLHGATVRAFAQGPGTSAFDAPRDPTPVAVAATAGDGVAHFEGLPPGTWTFTAERGGYARRGLVGATVRGGVTEEHFHLALERGYRLEGRVLDASGDPVSGAPVLAIRRTLVSDSTTAPLALRTTTDREGRFVFGALPAADVILWAGWPHGRLAILAAVRLPGVDTLELVLLRGGRLEGQVTSADDGTPIADAGVSVSLQVLGTFALSFDVRTDGDGRYVLDLPMPGGVNSISAAVRGYRAQWAELDENIAVPTGTVVTYDLALESGGVITGRVLGPDGPLVGVDVGATNSSWYFSALTDRQGEFVLNGLPKERFLVLATLWGYTMPDRPGDPDHALAAGTAPARYVVDLAAAEEAEVELTLRAGGMLRGTVETHDGLPAAGAVVSAPNGGVATHASADGTFELGPMEPGGQEIEAVAAGGGARANASIAIPSPPGAPEPLTLRLGPEMRVRGKLFSASGAALEGAYVQIVAWDSSLDHPVTDEWNWLEEPRLPVNADGSFEHPVDGRMGAFVVRAGALGHRRSRSGRVSVAAGQPEVHVELQLEQGETFTGRVLNLDGDAVPGAYIAMVGVPPGTDPYSVGYPGAWGPPIVAIADQHGVFRVDGLEAGTHAIRAWAQGHLPDARLVTVPLDSGVDLAIVASLSIEGQVVYADGAVVAGARITAVHEDEGSLSEGRTDSKGRFLVPGLEAGTYRLEIAPSSDGRQNMVATSVAGVAAGTPDVRITVDRGLLIAGVVIDSDGTPLAGASVRATQLGGEQVLSRCTTGADGAFSLGGLPAGQVTVHLEAESMQGSGAVAMPVQAGTDNLRIDVPVPAQLSGVLAGPDGNPLSGQQLLIEPQAATSGSVAPSMRYIMTNADGSFQASTVEHARYSVVLTEHPSFTLPPGTTLVGGTSGVRLVAEIGEAVEGRLIDPDGKPVANVEVRASRDNTNRFTTSDADGRFRITGLRRGESYSVWVNAADWTTAEAALVDAPTSAVTLRLARKLNLAGRVVGADGDSLGSVLLQATNDAGSSWMTWTDDDGRFNLSGLPEGEYRLGVDRFGEGEYVECGTARAGATGVAVRYTGR